ncbi:VOC family protein [Cuneatibacter sp. NSJ-177]|jgi:methylmalonyl-CoA epimerase|uniref:VOC family protein n=1 Tax=Cuneatibacter sp. NSJ-177 TaxID=2931401 RepID=UPI001FD40E82|nr:VOC family protein [Cuneatibacter sp. NSJ-177]MCJ7834083.1 VOC family protein [Cuneatibacter sp. NSJ-177]
MNYVTTNRPGEFVFTQVGIVVKDLEQTVERYRKLMGAESDEIVEFNTGVRVAHLYFPDIDAQIELLSPTEEGNLWSEFLKENGGDGLHHLCFDTADYEKTRSGFLEKGVKLVREVTNEFDPRVKYSFFDTSELGFLTEIVNRREIKKMDHKG